MVSRPNPAGSRSWSVPTLLALLCAVWGSTWWAIRVCLRDQDPLASASLRFLVAGAAVAGIAPWLGRLHPLPAPPAWLWLATGALNFAASYGILYVAEQAVPSGVAAVLWAVFPLLMATSGMLWLGEPLRPRDLLGFAVAFAGIGVVFAGDFGGPAAARDVVPAALLLLGSPLASAIGTTLVKKHGGGVSVAQLNRNAMLFGAALLAAASLGCGEDWRKGWTAQALAATGYLAILGTAFTFGAYYWLLQRLPAARLSLISYVTPVLAVLLAAAVGDGALTPSVVGGSALVVAGIVLVVRRKPS